MSKSSSLSTIQTFSNPECEKNNSDNHEIIRPTFIHKLRVYPSKSISCDLLNKNSFEKEETKIESNSLNQDTLNLHDNILNFKNINNNYIKYNLNNKTFRSLPENATKIKSNILESAKFIYKELGDFCHITDFESHVINNNANKIIKNQDFLNIPIISNAFEKKAYKVNKNIFQISKNFYNIDNNSKSCEPTLSKSFFINKSGFTNNINTKSNDINKIKQQNININFNIPDNFLINFNIKEITIKNIQQNSNQDKMPYFINLKDAEKFLNNICNKFISNNENCNNLNNYNKEYIELIKISKGEGCSLLQKKRKTSLVEFENPFYINNNISNIDKEKLNQLKKKYKIKNNKKISEKSKKLFKMKNKKNGKKISLYLNQIQVNKTYLENFPFCPMLNIKENIKVEFLEGIIDTKKFIKINKKAELIKDERNIKYINNKLFQIIYLNKDENILYILHIKGFHILYLILYYYYQIQEDIKLLNKLYYSHASYDKLNRIKNILKILIKKCNLIGKKIPKSIV